MEIAVAAINYFEIFNGLHDLGCSRFISKTKLPSSLGLERKKIIEQMAILTPLNSQQKDDSLVDSSLLGHLQGFGLTHVPIKGDGNCFFSAVAFHLSVLLSSPSLSDELSRHLPSIGIMPTMNASEISIALRILVVDEWNRNADEYMNFLPDSSNYFREVANYRVSGYFGGPLGDLMPLAMTNVLGIPLAIITTESHTPIISVCPQDRIRTGAPMFLAYTSYGLGHYDAAVFRSETNEHGNYIMPCKSYSIPCLPGKGNIGATAMSHGTIINEKSIHATYGNQFVENVSNVVRIVQV